MRKFHNGLEQNADRNRN